MKKPKIKQKAATVAMTLTALLTVLSTVGVCLTLLAMVYDLSNASAVLPWLMGCAVSAVISATLCAAASCRVVSIHRTTM